MRTPWLRAYSSERSCSTPAPDAAISSTSSKDTDRKLAGVGDDPRVGREDAGDVGVDFAHVGAERGREGHGAGVGPAATERGHVAGVDRHALEAGHEHDVVLFQRRLDAVGADVEDHRLGVGLVGDDARLGASQRDRLVAEVVDRHRAQGAGDALAGGQQHVHLAGVRRLARPPRPSRSARRWSCRGRTAPRRPGGRVRAWPRSCGRHA